MNYKGLSEVKLKLEYLALINDRLIHSEDLHDRGIQLNAKVAILCLNKIHNGTLTCEEFEDIKQNKLPIAFLAGGLRSKDKTNIDLELARYMAIKLADVDSLPVGIYIRENTKEERAKVQNELTQIDDLYNRLSIPSKESFNSVEELYKTHPNLKL